MSDTPDPGQPETIVAFDFGLRRIGLAVGQQVTGSANPLGVAANSDSGPDWQRIGAILEEWCPDRLIVGLPGHGDGSPSDISEKVTQFIGELGRFRLPVDAVDERYSSVEARASLKHERSMGMRGRISKEAVDERAAVLIAERWLAGQPE